MFSMLKVVLFFSTPLIDQFSQKLYHWLASSLNASMLVDIGYFESNWARSYKNKLISGQIRSNVKIHVLLFAWEYL